MTQRQAKGIEDLTRGYFARPAKDVTSIRVASNGLLLPCASAWALLASAHLMWTLLLVGRYSYWFEYSNPLTSHILGIAERMEQHTWAYAIALLIAGAIGWDHWRAAASGPRDRHLAATLTGSALIIAAWPTWLETLSLAGPAVGLLALANVASVLVSGAPLKAPFFRRRPTR